MNRKEERKSNTKNQQMIGKAFYRFKEILLFTTVLLIISALMVSCKDDYYADVSTEPYISYAVSEIPEPSKNPNPIPVVTIPSIPVIEESSSIELIERVFTVNGRENHVFVMKIDVSAHNVRVEPYLSFNKIYGFETLSEMIKDSGAYAGVNSGFYFEYGRPSGLVVIDGQTVSPGTGRFESIIISDGEIKFEVVKTSITLKIIDMSMEIEVFNGPRDENETAVYSSFYGNTDRIDVLRKYLVIQDHRVTEYGITDVPKGIPLNGYVVALPLDYEFIDNINDVDVSVDISPDFEKGSMAYEGASMLIKDKESLAGDSMAWVGNLNHYDPRTCIGKFTDGSLGLVVIDGRQENYSTGTTGRETADILLELGFTDAFMLDGGASSSMFFNGNIVNRPSDMGIERKLAGAILIFIE